MSHRSSTIRRTLAVCGIALTVLSCMQQSRALCALAGCRPVTDSSLADAASEHEHNDCCDACEGEAASERHDDCHDGFVEAIPCSTPCSFCEPVAPRTSPPPVQFESLVSPMTITLAAPVVVCVSVTTFAILSEPACCSSLATCVKLCRFLS